MTKLPPISAPISLPRSERGGEVTREKKDLKEVQEDHPEAPLPVEAEMTHAELQREAEKKVEGQLAATSSSEEDDAEKQARDREIERQEAAKNPDQHLWTSRGTQPGLKKTPHPQTPPPRDGFEQGKELKLTQKQTEKLAPSAPVSTPNPTVVLHKPGKAQDPMVLLNQAQPPGVYFREDSPGHSSSSTEDPELMAAVEETSALLREVRGIHRVVPGQSEHGDSAVIVVAERGFGEAAMRQIPSQVRRFPTLVAIPYDLLPLRRER